jgi:hypothetical protein
MYVPNPYLSLIPSYVYIRVAHFLLKLKPNSFASVFI